MSSKIREFAAKPMSTEEKARQVKLISEKYNWDKIAERTLEVYKRAQGTRAQEHKE